MTSVRENLDRVVERIRAAESRAGRPAGSVALVGVTKGRPASVVSEAIAAGIATIGENRVQEAWEKKPSVTVGAHAKWHLIGHLQTNKVARALETFDVVETIDSARLAEAVGLRAESRSRCAEVLVEVKVTLEAAKTGVAPDELFALLDVIASHAWLRLRGLMAMGPLTDDAAEARAAFARARALAEAARARGYFAAGEAPALSMGMSDDLEEAILEGSTMVRVGRALFDEQMTR
ncbi:MAG: YggS family pyridoxal phosphate-dependent enzyme [bacterium]